MKKYLLKVVCSVIVLVLLTCGMSSCTASMKLNFMDERERAFALLDLADKNIEKSDSFTAELEMVAKGSFYDIDMEVTGEDVILLEGWSGSDLAVYRKSTMETKIDSEEIEINAVSTTEGYQDGKMFRTYKDDDVKEKLWSPITQTEYITYFKERYEDRAFDLEEEDCQSVSCVKEENKTWTVVLSDFTEEGVDQFVDLFDGIDEMIGEDFTVADVKVEVNINKEFYLKSMDLTLVFQAEDDADEDQMPKISQKMRFKKYGETEVEEMDFESYTEVDDLRLLTTFADALDERKEAEDGAFELSIKQLMTIAGSSKSVTENDEGTYSKQKNRYTYDITSFRDGYTYVIRYRNDEVQTVVKQSGKILADETEESTDREAEVFINNLLDPAYFSADHVSDVKIKDAEKGIYEFVLANPSADLLEQVASSVDGSLTRSDGILTVTLENGRLTKYEYELVAKFTTSAGTLSLKIIWVCEYSDAA